MLVVNKDNCKAPTHTQIENKKQQQINQEVTEDRQRKREAQQTLSKAVCVSDSGAEKEWAKRQRERERKKHVYIVIQCIHGKIEFQNKRLN